MKNRRLVSEEKADEKQKKAKDMKPVTVSVSKNVDKKFLEQKSEQALETPRKNVPIKNLINTSITSANKGPGEYMITVTFDENFDMEDRENITKAKMALGQYLASYVGGSVKDMENANLFRKAGNDTNTFCLKYSVESVNADDMAGTLVNKIEKGEDPRLVLERMLNDKIVRKLEREGGI